MNTQFYLTKENYLKTLHRLEKNLGSGEFAQYTQYKKQQIWKRIVRYARQLKISIKAPVIAACIAAGLALITPASAQTFTQQTGTNNPLDIVSVGSFSLPSFVDVDGDGDKDVFVADFDGNLNFFRNTGSATAPVFTQQTGSSNPFDGLVLYGAAPTFADIDNDGDQDAFIGSLYGVVDYYKNTGSATAPVFTLQDASANPLSAVNVSYYALPVLVDIDNDGDQDVFVGGVYGDIVYYKNTGTINTPVYTVQTGTSNPFNAVDEGPLPTLAFADLDLDGDKDAVIGNNNGTFPYYKNTGTATAPVFTLQTGTNDPFAAFSVPYTSTPAFADIDGDGDQDLFSGQNDGTISFFRNTTTVLPLQLLGFNGSRQTGYNKLQWQTTNEVNTRSFELERSTDGRTFTRIATLNATGNNGSNGNYNYNDNTPFNGKVYYRLKMIDADSRFTYSQVIWLSSGKNDLITIYPNPATELININAGAANLVKTVAYIYDAKGAMVQRVLINAPQQQINVQQFAKGIYQIKFSDGTTQQFIKQ